MATKILMPRLSDTMHEGIISEWYKNESDKVEEDEPLFVVETDKASVEVHSAGSGILLKILCQEGESASVGDLVAIIGEQSEDIQPLLVSQKTTPRNTDESKRKPEAEGLVINASPVAKRKAKLENIDLRNITGTGKNGIITERDVLDYINKGEKLYPDEKYGPEEFVPLEGIRKAMAGKMTKSLSIPQVTTVAEADLSDLMRLSRKKSIKITSFMIHAVVRGLKQFPFLNASLNGGCIIIKKYYNIGVSVATPRGLIVPVLHNLENKDIYYISKKLSELSEKARNNQLSIEEISGGTFTVSNSGVFGSLFFTPIINAPESSILGIGKIIKQPVVLKDEIVIRSMIYLCLSYDHRIIDGESAVKFLQEIKRSLEAPHDLL